MNHHGEGSFLDIQRLLDETFEERIYRRWAIPVPAAWRPRLDVHETRDEYVIDVDLPGVPPERVEIRVAGHTLTITGTRPATTIEGTLASHRECESGSFRRSLTLPLTFAPDQVQAEYHHGTYRIRLSKQRFQQPAAEADTIETGAGRLIQITIS